MGFQYTSDQIVALAPDAASATAGKKLAAPRTWQNLGQNAVALWGQCQGSALYDVGVDLQDLSVFCTCPSRKFPCKHALGLLLMAATFPAALSAGEVPERIGRWLAERGEKAAARAAKVEALAEQAATPLTAEQQKRAEKRAEKKQSRTAEGLEILDRWLNDVIRNGLAAFDSESTTQWEVQAKRLVDAQVPGLAAYVKGIAAIPGATPDWPKRLLDRLGRLAILTEAFRHMDELDPPLQEELRQIIGWNVTADEVLARGESVEDDWLVVGQWVAQDELRPLMRTQRTWMLGSTTQRAALHLQFAGFGEPFTELIAPTTHWRGALRFWPGAAPVRARIEWRHSDNLEEMTERLPGAPTIEAFLEGMVDLLVRQPWQATQRLCVLRDVVPYLDPSGRWWVRDAHDYALALARGDHWRLLALSGGHPIDLVSEWNGEVLHPLGVLADGRYCLLGGTL